jgi:DNA polymerase kappa
LPLQNKPNGQFQLTADAKTILAFMRDLSIRKVFGIGRVNERLLESIGIKVEAFWISNASAIGVLTSLQTCGDIFTHRATIALMDKQFGLHYLLKMYLGIASNEVRPPRREERKSIGSERYVKVRSGWRASAVLIWSRTFSPLDDRQVLLQKLEHIASELESDMSRNGWAGKTVTLKYKLDTYQGEIFSQSLATRFGLIVSCSSIYPC